MPFSQTDTEIAGLEHDAGYAPATATSAATSITAAPTVATAAITATVAAAAITAAAAAEAQSAKRTEVTGAAADISAFAGDADHLCTVIDICMLCDELAVFIVGAFKDHERLSGVARGHLKAKLNLAVWGIRRELFFSLDSGAFAGFLIHEFALDHVLFAHDQAAVFSRRR